MTQIWFCLIKLREIFQLTGGGLNFELKLFPCSPITRMVTMQQSHTSIPGSPSLPTLQQPGWTGLVWVRELLLSGHLGKPGGTWPPQPLAGGFRLPIVGSRVLPA